jgi:hypothetical protein
MLEDRLRKKSNQSKEFMLKFYNIIKTIISQDQVPQYPPAEIPSNPNPIQQPTPPRGKVISV